MSDFPRTSTSPQGALTAGPGIADRTYNLRPGVVTCLRFTVDGADADDFAALYMVPSREKATFGGVNGLKRLHSVGQPIWPKGTMVWRLQWTPDNPAWTLFYARKNGASADLTVYVQQWEEAVPPGAEIALRGGSCGV